jgi:hypothetical protein
MVRFIPRPSPAMVVACLALVVALGGTSYAVVSLPPNSVGTAQLRANAVVSSKVKNRSLLAVDFKAGQIPTGPPGPKGDKGDPGTSGVSGYELISARSDVTNQLFNSVSLSCPTGKKAVGGGGATAGGIVPGDGPYIVVNQPSVDGTGWLVQTARGTSGGSVLLGYAICATVS